MNNQVKNASTEDILHDICYYEDPDSSLLINTTKDGEVFISNQEWQHAVTAPSMQKALIKYQVKVWEDLGYSKEQAKRDSEEFHKLDWSTAISHIKEETPNGDQTH